MLTRGRTPMLKRRLFNMTILGSLLAGARAGTAATTDVVRIGVLTDLTSPASGSTGMADVEATKMAVEDFGGTVAGKKIEVIFADFQNKADIAATIARDWLDEQGVDVITDLSNSAAALAVSTVVREKNKVLLAVPAGSAVLTGASCSPNTIQWVYDTWALASATRAIVAGGGKTWFFITVDYTFGHDLQSVAEETVKAAGGTVIGNVQYPMGETDFASELLQAQASGAQVIGLASAAEGITLVKQAAEFGITRGNKQQIFVLITTTTEINAAGLDVTQGLLLSSPWYWDQDDASRAFTKRLQERIGDKVVNQFNAGSYSAITHYLKAVAAVGDATDGRKVVEKMKELPTSDPLYKEGYIRADGRKIHPMNIYQVKKPEESKYKYDLLRFVRSVPGEQAFRPLSAGGCPLVKSQ